MTSKVVVLAVLGFAILVQASLERWESTHVHLYTRNGAPPNSHWTLLKKTDKLTIVNFSIALKQRNLDILEEIFWANADPDSGVYAQHKTREEIMSIIAPPKSEQKKVIQWIIETAEAEQAIARVEIQNFQDLIRVRAPVHVVERLFQTKMFTFLNTRNNRVTFKHMGSISLPEDIIQFVDMVTGITELPPTISHFVGHQEREVSLRQVADNACNTPYTLKKLYNIPNDLVVTNKDANSSIYAEADPGSQEGYGIPSLADFEKANALPVDPINCILGNYVGDYFVNDTDGEAQLDTQMMTGMAAGAQICFYIMDSNNGWMFEFANQIFQTPNAPLVVSMSYAWNEIYQCSNASNQNAPSGLGNCTYLHIPDSKTYVDRTNVEFKKLGVLGHSLVSASGDDGVAGNHGSLDNCATLGPLFPADSPYVTSVGATSVEPSTSSSPKLVFDSDLPPICTNSFFQCNCSTSTNEQPASGENTAGFDTGGGFSVNNPMPPYQKNAVNAYLSSGVALPPQSYWNKNNRGYPDIAAVGENFCVLDPGQSCSLAAGTSASAPLIASLITLLNQDRLNAGKNPLGFFNMVLYKMFDTNATKYFNNNFPSGNNGADCGPSLGFNSIAGHWTPLTGVGSPKFDEIRKYVATLP